MKGRMRTVAAAAVLAVLGTLFIGNPAYAVETDAVRTAYFAQFNDGRVGWFKLVVEKNSITDQGRAKITVWCEPNTTLGGDKVACDAIDLSSTHLSVQYWSEGSSAWFDEPAIYSDAGSVDYSPPLAGLAFSTIWQCGTHGLDQYRGYAANFRAASSNQWSQYYLRVTPTWNGRFC